METKTLLDNLETIEECPGGIERLRKLIIELAIRGSLIRPILDEPAVTLDGRRQERDVYPELPQNWVYARLENIAKYGRAGQKSASEILESDWVLDLADIEPVTSRLLRKATLAERPTTSLKFSFQAGDLLYSKLRPYLDKVLIAPDAGFCTTEIVPIVPSDLVRSEWLRLSMKSTRFLRYANSKSYGMKMPRLGTDDALASIHPLPPLNEQDRIVAKVDELMRLCDELESREDEYAALAEATRRSMMEDLCSADTEEHFVSAWRRVASNWSLTLNKPAALQEMRQSVKTLALSGRLTTQKSEDETAADLIRRIQEERQAEGKKVRRGKGVHTSQPTAALPRGWAWARFDEIADIKSSLVDPSGYSDLPHVAPDSIEKGTGRLLSYRTIAEDGVTSSKHLFFDGQILYSKIRPNLSKAVYVDFDGLCSADMYPLLSRIDPGYLLIVILSPYFVRVVTQEANRLAMPKVNQDQLNATWIPVPPLKEQRQIVEIVDQLRAACDDVERNMSIQQEIAGRWVRAVVQELEMTDS